MYEKETNYRARRPAHDDLEAMEVRPKGASTVRRRVVSGSMSQRDGASRDEAVGNILNARAKGLDPTKARVPFSNGYAFSKAPRSRVEGNGRAPSQQVSGGLLVVACPLGSTTNALCEITTVGQSESILWTHVTLRHVDASVHCRAVPTPHPQQTCFDIMPYFGMQPTVSAPPPLSRRFCGCPPFNLVCFLLFFFLIVARTPDTVIVGGHLCSGQDAQEDRRPSKAGQQVCLRFK